MSSRPNRVTPEGEIVAIPLRGSWMGNRGILHDEDGTLVRHHANRAWITCVLAFRGRRVPQWQPHRYTVLFFHDEVVSMAAGHRPCAECRRADYHAYRDAVGLGLGLGSAREPLRAGEIDARLMAERLVPRTPARRLHERSWSSLPDGTFVVEDGSPWLLRGDDLVAWTTAGYAGRRHRPHRGTAAVLTPPTTVAALTAGYTPQVAGGPGPR